MQQAGSGQEAMPDRWIVHTSGRSGMIPACLATTTCGAGAVLIWRLHVCHHGNAFNI